MPKLVITDVPPYDGEYDLEIDTFTNGELWDIEDLTGLRAGDIPDALAAASIKAFIACTYVLLRRAGFENVDIEILKNANNSCFDVKFVPGEEDADRPLAEATSGGEQSAAVASNEQSDPTAHSGTTGSGDGESNPPTPLATGDLGSVTSADFARSTSDD